jgi:hypothetical protein
MAHWRDAMLSQAKITAKHEKQVRSALRKASKAPAGGSAKKAASVTGACTLTFGGGFKVCQDGVTESACNEVAGQMGGTPSFDPGKKCKS